MSFTRRTHIVRVPLDPASSGTAPTSAPSNYIDVEVLDAIAFKIDRNKEVILSVDALKADPYIVDNTGGDNQKTPGSGTRRSHMKRITSKSDPAQQLDIEVIDIVAFRDQNGGEWILDMSGTSDDPHIFDTTTGAGSSSATRRTHDEKISFDLKDLNPAQYLTVSRSDDIAFRTIAGREMIISCPSNDDPGSSDPRASTYTTPKGYDPTNPDGPKPPLLADSGDKSVYVSAVKDASGFMTGDEPIAQGPLWWIRKISGGEILVLKLVTTRSPHPKPGLGSDFAPVPNQFIPIGVAMSGAATVVGINSPVDGNLADGNLDAKIMPVSLQERPKIDLKNDNSWWTGIWNQTSVDQWTTLIFLNVDLLRKTNSDITVTFSIPRLVKPTTSTGGLIGYYVWDYSGRIPPPDATNAFGPSPPAFGAQSCTNYIGIWNSSDLFGCPRTPLGDAGGYGWSTPGGAAAFCATANAGSGRNFQPLTLDFANETPPPDIPTMSLAITAMVFSGKTAFEYDGANNPLFDPPTDPLIGIKKNYEDVYWHTAPFNGSTIVFKMDKNGVLSSTETISPPPPSP